MECISLQMILVATLCTVNRRLWSSSMAEVDHFAVRIIRRNSVEGSVRITNCTDHRHCLLLLCLNRLIQFLSWVQRCFLALRVEALTHLLLEEASLMLLLILAL